MVKLMNIRWTIHLLALLGVVASVIYEVIMNSNVNDATFEGGPISKKVWILITIFESVWILMPYLILAKLNESRKSMFRHPRMFISLMIVILSMAVYLMLDITVFNPDPLGGVLMLFWPPIQILLILAAWGTCK